MTILRGFVIDRRRSTLWWSAGMVALVAFTVMFYPSIRDQASFSEVFESLPEALRAFLGAQENVPITSAPGYLHTRVFSTFLPVLLLVLGIGLGSRAIGGSEEDGTLELLLTKPVTRGRVVVERFLASIALLVVISAVFTATLLALAPPFDLTEGTSLVRIVIACAAVTCLALLHSSIAFAVGCAVGRRSQATAVAGAVAVAAYLINGVAALSDAARPLRFVSPWHWALSRNPLVDGVGPEAFIAPLLASAAIVAIGARIFVSRDLR